MKIHEHNQEIILALAEGTLDEVAAAAAEAELAECAECTHDLEMQRLALAVLDDAPEVYLTATESSRLHEALKRDLTGIKPVPAPRRSTVAWGRWLSVFAGTAAVFLVVFMLLPNVMGGGDDSSSDMTFAAATDSADDQAGLERTTVASAETVAPEMVAGAAEDGASLESATDIAEAPAATTTTAAAATTETTASDSPTYVEALPVIGFGDLSEELRQEIIAQLLADPDDLRLRDEMAKSATLALDPCLAEQAAALDIPASSQPMLVGLLAGDDGEERLVVAYVPDDVTETVLVVVTYPGCELFQTVP